MSNWRRLAVRVEGTVQGVGFRPFVFRLANELGLKGFVGNDPRGVFIEAQGGRDELEAFVARLALEQPALADVRRVEAHEVPLATDQAFRVVASAISAPSGSCVPVTADAATCDACLDELFDPAARRYRYPFVNCTDCGPRFTIVRRVPYDRANTTMSGFPMCEACRAEYADPADRRYHAEATCCPDCGPRLALLGRHGEPMGGPQDALDAVAHLLWEERVVAIKGLGGYHLATLAGSQRAVSALRSRKHREEKPFALMVAGIDQARTMCHVDEAERELLQSAQRPIVLLRRRAGASAPDGLVAPDVAPGANRLGLMLPYTGLHHLLLRQVGEPIVLTSGNVSDEPIAYRDDDALERLAGIADAFLVHDRPIQTRCDDSVATVVAGRSVVVRRSRGYAPAPLQVPVAAKASVLACGAELKSTICLLEGQRAVLSHHIGDLENAETLASFEEAVHHYAGICGSRPSVVAHDMHPEYLSTKFALAWVGSERVAVQHHHAHIASCMADNDFSGPVIGIAFDGLGMGDDATLWGGEVLVATFGGYERVASCLPVALPGGAAAVRQPWRMAAAYADLAFGDDTPARFAPAAEKAELWAQMCRLSRAGAPLSPTASSIGRLFDAVGAVVCGRYEASFEGQAAVDLEEVADPGEMSGYACSWSGAGPRRLDTVGIFASAVEDLLSGSAPGVVAARFHNTLAQSVAQICSEIRDERGVAAVALSGGVFQNRLLTERTVGALSERGFSVLTHRQVPPNDGGISLGQAVVAAAQGY